MHYFAFNVSLMLSNALAIDVRREVNGKFGFLDSSSCSSIIRVCFLVCFKEKIAQPILMQVRITLINVIYVSNDRHPLSR